VSIETTFRVNPATWRTIYDQAGVVISFFPTNSPNKRWIKAGFEIPSISPITQKNLPPAASVVTGAPWSDWSVVSLLTEAQQSKEVQIKMELVKVGNIQLDVYASVDGGAKIKLREIRAFFADAEKQAVEVGITVAKPKPTIGDEQDELAVEFGELVVRTV
jgi:regulation of enolase protein 1 (concanavalin A-like superfamily)